jgi:hypothetical protein
VLFVLLVIVGHRTISRFRDSLTSNGSPVANVPLVISPSGTIVMHYKAAA